MILLRRFFNGNSKFFFFVCSSSSESRKRKLEELIPKNTGVTLIKKSKVNLPDNTFVQSKRVPPQRARGEYFCLMKIPSEI